MDLYDKMQLLSSKHFEERLEEESGNFNRNWTRIFHLICSISAFSLTCWCIYKYMKDEDVSLVNYKRYHSDKNSIYPSLTLCFNNPFLNDRLESFGKEGKRLLELFQHGANPTFAGVNGEGGGG